MGDKKQKNPFGRKFLWGASSAAHQIEGGNDNQWTRWELENARSLAAQAEYQSEESPIWDEIKDDATDPRNYVSGKMFGHYDNYEPELEILEKLHMNAYRFSIEWSRIEPEEGAWDAGAVDHYRKLLTELKARGIEPVVTLLHFTLPTWFADKGGFEKRANVKYFTHYAERIVDELGKNMRYIITINEPEVYAAQSYWEGSWPPNRQGAKWKLWRVMNNQARAHNRAARAIHRLGRRYKVSIAKNSSYFYPGDDAWLTRVSSAVMQWFQDDYFLRKVVKNSDFIGVNYYFTHRVYGYRVHNPEEKLSDLGWDMHPADIEYALERLSRKYKKPLLITENGLADKNDEYRKWWIASTLAAMQRAIEQDVKLLGYLHWSLTDNFEWMYGKWPRFGLAEVNYKNGKRELRPSAKWFAKIIHRLRED